MNRPPPFFSVVLTTRNRANLLPFAIRSVLAQSYPDFEIVVSDNFSSDNTPEVAQCFGDPRISYVRTSESLPMRESYSFALSHAHGEYITFLSDDDSFTINVLERAKSLIHETNAELLCWKHAYYYLNPYRTDERPFSHPLRRIEKNSLAIPAFSSRLFEVDAVQSLKRSLLGGPPQPESVLTPEPHGALLTNAVYHRTLLSRIKERRLDLFRQNVIPDIYAAFVTGLLAGKYFFLDEPLTIFSVHGSSATANYAADKSSLAKQFEESPGSQRQLLTPIQSFLNRNYYLNSILQAQQDVGHAGDEVTLNRKQYYLEYHAEIMAYRRRGVDITEERNAFETALLHEPDTFQKEVRAAILLKRSVSLKGLLRRFPRPSVLTKRALRYLPGSLHRQSILIRGEDAGFKDLAECAAWLNADRLRQLSGFWLDAFHGRTAGRNLSFKWRVG